MIVKVKFLRGCRHGEMNEIKEIDVSQTELDALVKYKFIKVDKTKKTKAKESK